MADTQVKPEIKVDPAAASSANMADLEQYEDDTDLHIPAPPPPDGDGNVAWLVKVPKYLWEAWDEIARSAPDDGGNVQIGSMLVYDPEPGQDPDKPRTQIKLTPGVFQHRDLPKTYDLDIKTTGYSNTVVFSEKDLPGHNSSRPFSSARGSKPRGIPPKSERYGGSNNKPGTYRTAIPKQTALAPLIQHVADAAPEQDASYYAHFDKMYKASQKPKKSTTFYAAVDRTVNSSASHLTKFPGFNISSKPGYRSKKAPPKEKAVRMSEKDLYDALCKCFGEYKYWPLKGLRNKLRQPEAYIKQTLEQIATLVRSGQFAMNYMLKPEYDHIITAAANQEQGKVEPKEETAVVKSEVEESELEPDEVLGSGDDDDDDDALDDLEDVKMEGE